MSPPGEARGPSDDPAPGIGQRLSRALLAPPPPKPPPESLDFARMDDDTKRAYIVQIDPIEHKVGLAAAVLGVVLAIYAFVVPMFTKPVVPWTTVKPKGKVCPSPLTYVAKTGTCNGVYDNGHYALYLGISLVLALAIYVTVRIRRRAPLAFAMVMTGLAFGTILILVPYGVGAGWIMLRAWRTQRYGAPTATSKNPVEGWTAPPPRAGGRRGRAAAPRKGKAAATTNGASRKAPEANKRYTPKTPPKPKNKAVPPKA